MTFQYLSPASIDIFIKGNNLHDTVSRKYDAKMHLFHVSFHGELCNFHSSFAARNFSLSLLGNLHWDLINHEKMLENCSMTSSSIDNVRRDEMSRTFNVFAIPHIIIARFTQRASSSHEKMTLMDALERWKKKTCFKLTVRICSYLTHSLWCATRAKYRERKNEKVLDEPLRTSRGDGAFRVQLLDTILWNFIQYLEEILVIIISCYLTVHYHFFLTSFFTWKII